MRSLFMITASAVIFLNACGGEPSESTLLSTFPVKNLPTTVHELSVSKAPDGITPDTFALSVRGTITIADNDCLATGKTARFEITHDGATLFVRPLVQKLDSQEPICTEEYAPVHKMVLASWKGSRANVKKIVIENVNQMNETVTVEP